jgi:hypothetical protein
MLSLPSQPVPSAVDVREAVISVNEVWNEDISSSGRVIDSSVLWTAGQHPRCLEAHHRVRRQL